METIAIQPIQSLDAVVRIPGSKSYTQRGIIIAALAQGTSRLSHFLISEDTAYLIEALRKLGATIRREEGQDRDKLIIEGTAGRIAAPSGPIYLGNNGTAMRFLTTPGRARRGTLYADGRSPSVRASCRRPARRPERAGGRRPEVNGTTAVRRS